MTRAVLPNAAVESASFRTRDAFEIGGMYWKANVGSISRFLRSLKRLPGVSQIFEKTGPMTSKSYQADTGASAVRSSRCPSPALREK